MLKNVTIKAELTIEIRFIITDEIMLHILIYFHILNLTRLFLRQSQRTMADGNCNTLIFIKPINHLLKKGYWW
jgi:hypothetical protein